MSILSTSRLMGFIPARDLGRVRGFYETVLGLQFVSQDNFGVMMEFNGSPIRIQRVADYTPLPFTILGWLVHDVIEAVKALMDKGVVFERFAYLQQDEMGIWTNTTGDRVAWFKDPEGNTLSVSQSLSARHSPAFDV